VSSVEFRHWKSLCKSNCVMFQLLSDFIQLVSADNDDEEYEEIDDDA